MEIFNDSSPPTNKNVFSSIPTARNKFARHGRSTALAVLLVYIDFHVIIVLPFCTALSQVEIPSPDHIFQPQGFGVTNENPGVPRDGDGFCQCCEV